MLTSILVVMPWGGTKGIYYGWVVLGAAFWIALLFWSTYASFGVFLRPLSEEFGWSRGTISLAATLNLVIGGVLGFVVGSLTDKYGPRSVMAGSGVFIGLSYILASQITSLWHFYLLAGLMLGAGLSSGYIVPTATVARWFVARRGLVMGIVLMAIGVAYMIGPPLAAFLITSYGWRSAYLLLGVGVWVLALPVSILLKRAPEDIGLTPYGQGPDPVQASPAGPSGGLRPGGVVRTHVFWSLFLSWFLLAFALMMVSVHLVPYATDRGLGLAAAAGTLTLYGVSNALGRLAFGGLGDRVGNRVTFLLAAGLQMVALFWLIGASALWTFYLLAVFFGLGASGADTVIVKAMPELFGTRSIGAVIGIFSLGWRLGAASGPPAAGFIYDATGVYSLAFLVSGLGVILALFLTLRAFRVPRVSDQVGGIA